MIPPAIIHVRIRSEKSRGFGLWLPIFLLWPLLLMLLIVALPICAIAEIVLLPSGMNIRPASLLIAALGLLDACRGIDVAVAGSRGNASVKVHII